MFWSFGLFAGREGSYARGVTETSPAAEDPPASGSRPRRSDALRNIDAILDAAEQLLPERPRASMQDVAEAAGVHRATVHRHFASRDDLLAALRHRGLDAIQRILVEAADDDGDPAEALDRLIADTLRLGDRMRLWRILPTYDDLSDARSDALLAPLLHVMERAQAAGAVRGDVDARLLAAAWGGLVTSAMPHVANGAMDVDTATAYVRRMLGPSDAA